MTSCMWQISWAGSSEWHLLATLYHWIHFIYNNHRFDIFPSLFYYVSQCKNAYANRADLFVSMLKTTKSILHGKSSCVCRCLTKLWFIYMLTGIMAPGWARKGSVLTGAESGKLFTSRLRCLWSDYGQVLWKTQDVVSAGVLMHLQCCHFNKQ